MLAVTGTWVQFFIAPLVKCWYADVLVRQKKKKKKKSSLNLNNKNPAEKCLTTLDVILFVAEAILDVRKPVHFSALVYHDCLVPKKI